MEAEAFVGAMLETSDKVGQLHKRIMQPKIQPIYKTYGGSSIGNGSSPLLVRLEARPSAGRCWNILRVGLFGSDGHTALANVVADVYSGNNPDPFTPTFDSQVLSGLAVPSITVFSSQTEWTDGNGEVFALLYSVPAAQQVVMVVRVGEYPLSAQEAMSI